MRQKKKKKLKNKRISDKMLNKMVYVLCIGLSNSCWRKQENCGVWVDEVVGKSIFSSI